MSTDEPVIPQRDWQVATTADHVAIWIGTGIWCIDVIAVVYAIINYRYPPLKAKQVHLIAVALVASILWWIGNLQATGALGHVGIFRICLLWGVWVQAIFGVQLLLTVLVYRLYKLHRILIQEKPARGWQFWTTVLIFWLPMPIIGLAAHVLGEQRTIYYHAENDWCQWAPIYKYAMLPLPIVGLSFLLWLNIALRNTRKSFNEYREQRIGFIVSLIVLVSYTLVDGVFVVANKLVWARVLQASLVLLAGNIYFWVMLGGPLFGFTFAREAYLEKFRKGLTLSALNKLSEPWRGKTGMTNATTRQTSQPSALKLPDGFDARFSMPSPTEFEGGTSELRLMRADHG
ncbi:uncharacterized protein SPPG_02534 [Spizellomyces punctatus DAOM BR117]|uniref:G-protein coupled receptors family 2 profile 2 domain-containing protein n=1 Tax=Spizellomyces punctatus (strain DAOM BR117) TaxID=645134 RepID=A0A0L0HKN4_SPIPD|nr:uncharacterized protein SPPG_02534 [Spizellomyces punctatus DAOM BR117]KND02031.1 hypothetical protein SPPG_02534 [Spizellomyces punctatus DAOM BR117]|eukprot:XP_016610070.1 hypothetical protein SPPG_02534 [Spizellomyces punctatus DAOM BR117]